MGSGPVISGWKFWSARANKVVNTLDTNFFAQTRSRNRGHTSPVPFSFSHSKKTLIKEKKRKKKVSFSITSKVKLIGIGNFHNLNNIFGSKKVHLAIIDPNS